MKMILLPIPPVAEQASISAYLDQETSRIDTLISKKEQLIEKLLERRQALITQVVTKGLDPNVPMKDSGVKWLGEVPKGWTTKPIWSISKAFAGGTPESSNPEYWDDAEGTPWIAIGDMSDVTRVLSTSKAVSMLGRTIKRLPFGEPGDVLFAMYASVGATAILGIRATWNQAILGLRIDSRLADEKFVFFLLKGISDVWNLLSNSNTQSNLNQHSVMHLRISLPGKSEQAKIAAYLDQETSQMDTLVEKTRRAIELLKERRQALITQVVTGKIDVGGFAGGNS
jgi:type I restriction enzyme S subunit